METNFHGQLTKSKDIKGLFEKLKLQHGYREIRGDYECEDHDLFMVHVHTKRHDYDFEIKLYERFAILNIYGATIFFNQLRHEYPVGHKNDYIQMYTNGKPVCLLEVK